MPRTVDNSAPKILRKASLAIFKDKKTLMVRDDKNELAFFTPGGKIEEGETAEEAVMREIKEELGIDIEKKTLKFLVEFEAPAHGKPNVRVNIRFFTAEFVGRPQPQGEIVEMQYFDSSVNQKHLTPISIDYFFPWLKKHGYIN